MLASRETAVGKKRTSTSPAFPAAPKVSSILCSSSSHPSLACPLALASRALPAFAAGPITGVVTNKTTNKPSAGDDVVLIRLQQGMQESTRTKTDAHGKFSLDVPDDGVHLVRVTHDKANYFRPAPPGTQSVEIDVYNSAAHVKGVTGEADVMRIQTDPGGKTLSIIENFFIKNESNPPLTQFSDRPFEFVLPEGAVVEGSAALAPGGMPVQSAPVPLPEKGHYTFLFPIRPGDNGETRFQVKYHVPYSGSQAFSPSPSIPTDTVAIMLPKSMTFKADTDAYSPVTDEPTAQTYVARNVAPAQPLGFTISGIGELPRDSQDPDQGSGNRTMTSRRQRFRGCRRQRQPRHHQVRRRHGQAHRPRRRPRSLVQVQVVDPRRPRSADGCRCRCPAPPPAPSAIPAAAAPPAPAAGRSITDALQQALKEEFFALETDRLQKKISEEEYAAYKRRSNLILLRSLNGSPAPSC